MSASFFINQGRERPLSDDAADRFFAILDAISRPAHLAIGPVHPSRSRKFSQTNAHYSHPHGLGAAQLGVR